MYPIHVSLSKSQASKLKRNQPVQIKAAGMQGPVKLVVHPETAKRYHKAMIKGSGMRIQLTPAELQASGFFDTLKNIGQQALSFTKSKALPFLKENVLPQVKTAIAPIVRQQAEAAADKAVKAISSKSELLGSLAEQQKQAAVNAALSKAGFGVKKKGRKPKGPNGGSFRAL